MAIQLMLAARSSSRSGIERWYPVLHAAHRTPRFAADRIPYRQLPRRLPSLPTHALSLAPRNTAPTSSTVGVVTRGPLSEADLDRGKTWSQSTPMRSYAPPALY